MRVMAEIYWLQRLGSLNTLMWVIFVIATFTCIVCGIWRCVIGDDPFFDTEKKFIKGWMKIFKPSLIISFIAIVLAIFIPTTKEAYMIYGIGGTIDYLKENETAKQLPDKVINALDNWVDELSKENKKD